MVLIRNRLSGYMSDLKNSENELLRNDVFLMVSPSKQGRMCMGGIIKVVFVGIKKVQNYLYSIKLSVNRYLK